MKITRQDIQEELKLLNRHGDHYSLFAAGTSPYFKLVVQINESGGVRDVLNIVMRSKRDMFNAVRAYRIGLESGIEPGDMPEVTGAHLTSL